MTLKSEPYQNPKMIHLAEAVNHLITIGYVFTVTVLLYLFLNSHINIQVIDPIFVNHYKTIGYGIYA